MTKEEVIEYVRQRCIMVDDCWAWGGSFIRGKTPAMRSPGKAGSLPRTVRAIVLEQTNTKKPNGKWKATYTCTNPKCVKPDHVAWKPASHIHKKASADGAHDSMLKNIRKARAWQAMSKWTWDDIRAIRAKFAAGVPYADLVAEYGMSKSSVHRVVKHQVWVEYEANPFAGLFTGLAANDSGRKRA